MGAIRNQATQWASAGVLFALLAGACQSPTHELDLRENPALYQATGYHARVVVDRDAFVPPLVDERKAVVDAGSGRPRRYVPDESWPRPLLTMVEEIVIDELRDSGIFTDVRRSAPTEETLIVTAYVVRANCYEEEHPTGRLTSAEVELRLVVYGPGPSADARPVLFERSFPEIVKTQVQMAPPSPPHLIGPALRKALLKALAALDQSNVSRSGVPMDPSVSGR